MGGLQRLRWCGLRRWLAKVWDLRLAVSAGESSLAAFDAEPDDVSERCASEAVSDALAVKRIDREDVSGQCTSNAECFNCLLIRSR